MRLLMNPYIFKKIIFFIFLPFIFLPFGYTYAGEVFSEGSAQIVNNNLVQARFEAYQNALKQAALNAGVNISSTTSYSMNEGMTDSIQIRSNQSIHSSEILSESIDSDILTVQIVANIAQQESINNTCDFPAAKYRKRIAALFFPLQNPQHLSVVDYYDFEKGIGKELLQRLSLSDDFLIKEAEHINLYHDTGIAPFIQETDTSDGHSLLSSMEKDFDVQYVISGVIRDLSVANFNNDINLPFGLSIDRDKFVSLSRQAKQPKKRNLVIDFYLHDTLTEELISKHRYSYSIDDSMVRPDKAIAFGTKEFFDSDFGKLFDKVLHLESRAIRKVLACRPFTMKILEQDKKNIYLDAGKNSRIQEGDILTMYYADKEGDSFDTNSHKKQFGWPKSTIKIVKVFPSYSIATSTREPVVHLDKNSEYILVW